MHQFQTITSAQISDIRSVFLYFILFTLERQQARARAIAAAKMASPGNSNANLYIKNLDPTFTEMMLWREFEPYGTITSLKLMMDEESKCRGFGFVCYETPEEATRAIKEMNGKLIGLKPLYVRIHQKKEERKMELTNKFRNRLSLGNGGSGDGPHNVANNRKYFNRFFFPVTTSQKLEHKRNGNPILRSKY